MAWFVSRSPSPCVMYQKKIWSKFKHFQDGKKQKFAAPKVQRLVTPVMLQVDNLTILCFSFSWCYCRFFFTLNCYRGRGTGSLLRGGGERRTGSFDSQRPSLKSPLVGIAFHQTNFPAFIRSTPGWLRLSTRRSLPRGRRRPRKPRSWSAGGKFQLIWFNISKTTFFRNLI